MRHFRQSYAAQRGPEYAEALAQDLGMRKYRRKPTEQYAIQINEPFTVETLEGIMEGKPGDYLVIGTKGEQYPVAKNIFENIYIEINEGPCNGCMYHIAANRGGLMCPPDCGNPDYSGKVMR